MIPPKEDAEFVAAMEDVLAVCERPYDPQRPLVCLDEKPVQSVAETRQPIPVGPGCPARNDYEYERKATAVAFMVAEPLGGRRKVAVRETKTALDFAHEIEEIVDVDHPDAERVVLVCDNLNTHTPAFLYKAFEPAEARRILDRLEIHYTPKHGSWLDVAEIELSVFSEQRLAGRRIGDIDTLRSEASACLMRATPTKSASTGSSPTTKRTSNSSTSIRNFY